MGRIAIGENYTFYGQDDRSIGYIERLQKHKYLVHKCVFTEPDGHYHVDLTGAAARSFLTKCWTIDTARKLKEREARLRPESTDY